MSQRNQWAVLGSLVALYLVGLGGLSGVISERIRFDGTRNRVVAELQEATQRVHAKAIAWERSIDPSAPASTVVVTVGTARAVNWVTHIETVDAALAQRDVDTAERAWREAY